MSKFGLVIVLLLIAGSNYAQDYFVLIQTDNRQPFYVRLGSQVYSSSPGGHLILSQLKDSMYSLTIGLPGQSTVEQRYRLNIRQKDQEFRLKEGGDRGLNLYDGQTGEEKTPEAPLGGGEEARAPGIKKDDAFSRLMAGVVQDTSVLYNTYALEQVLVDSAVAVKAPSMDTSARVSVAAVSDSVNRGLTSEPVPIKAVDSFATPVDSSAANPAGVLVSHPPETTVLATAVPDTAMSVDTQALANPLYRPRVVKLSERKLANSVRLTYAEYSPGKKADTVILFLPVDTTAIAKGGQESTGMADTARVRVPQSSLPFVNSDCHTYATDYDVDKLRVRLLEGTKEDDRILAARKVFKTRCFTTRQIRALGEVFTTDAAKFRFFEAAYPFCSDDKFRELSSLLADPVYSSKFRVMTEHQ